jgi:glycosyltransferase involved in cell wall biosynthesis
MSRPAKSPREHTSALIRALDSVGVLHVDTGVTWRGGQQQVLLLLTDLAARGVRTEIVVRHGSVLGERAEAAGITVRRLSMRGDHDPRASFSLAHMAARSGVSLLHAHTAHAHSLLLPVAAARRLPLVVTRRNMLAQSRSEFPRRWVDPLFTRFKYRRATRILCVSHAVLEEMVSLGCSRERLVFAPSAVVAPRSLPSQMRDRGSETNGRPAARLVAVGSLDETKSYDVLLEALAILRGRRHDVTLAIAGDGPLRERLEGNARRLGVQAAVWFLGDVADPTALLASADLFVHPSRSEGTAGAILHALALRLPVVATAVGGIPEVLGHGSRGLLVPPDDPRSLAAACRTVLRDPVSARSLAERGRDYVLSVHTVERMVNTTVEVYQDVMRSSSDRAGAPRATSPRRGRTPADGGTSPAHRTHPPRR